MQLWYGTYPFPVDQADVAARFTVTRSASGRPMRLTRTLDVSATLFGDSQSEITTLELNLIRAVAEPYRDLVLKQDSGAPSGVRLLNVDSLSGVVLTSGPDFETIDTPDYVVARRARFSMEADYLLTASAGALVSYVESISVQGNGGPVRRWRVPVPGSPSIPGGGRAVRQRVSDVSIVRVVQQGSAVGHTRWPNPPPPIFGRDYLVNEAEAVSRQTPTPRGRGWVDYPVQWNYVFEAPHLLTGTPKLPTM